MIQLKDPARQREKQNISPTDFPRQLCWRHVHRLHPSFFVSVLFVEDWVINGNQVWLIHKPKKCSTETYAGQIHTKTKSSYWNRSSAGTLLRDEPEMNSLRDPLTFRDKQTESCQKIVGVFCRPKTFAFMEKMSSVITRAPDGLSRGIKKTTSYLNSVSFHQPESNYFHFAWGLKTRAALKARVSVQRQVSLESIHWLPVLLCYWSQSNICKIQLNQCLLL